MNVDRFGLFGGLTPKSDTITEIIGSWQATEKLDTHTVLRATEVSGQRKNQSLEGDIEA